MFIKKSLTVGHRGCRRIGTIPENSLSSFQFAIDHGCKAIELDCRLTLDHQVVVFHDDLIGRVCTQDQVDGARFISDLTLEQVKSLTFKNHTIPDERIPTLEEVLVYCSDRDVKVFVELKCMTPRESIILATKVVEIFNKLKAHEYACVITFSPIAVYYVRKLQPLIETCILYSNNFFHHAVVNGIEKSYPIVNMFHMILDQFYLHIGPWLVPYLTGCTMVGPDAQLLSKLQMVEYSKRSIDVYCWVANTPSELDFFIDFKASVGTDYIFPIPVHPSQITLPDGNVAITRLNNSLPWNTCLPSVVDTPIVPSCAAEEPAIPSVHAGDDQSLFRPIATPV